MEIAQKVLSLQGDACAVLSVLMEGPAVTPATPVALVRRAYMRLAALIHPDKLPGFDRATEAFQVVVRCFDAFANGDVTAQPTKATKKNPSSTSLSSKAAKTKAIAKEKPKSPRRTKDAPTSSDSDEEPPAVKMANFAPKNNSRSNDGCRVTPMACPRCETPWVPDTPKLFTLVMAYNHKIHCETCLLHYGWATAHHFCPHCKRDAEYDPHNYNSTVNCTHCRKPYGYMHFPIDGRILAEMASQRATEAREAEARAAREDRMARRAGAATDDLDYKVGQCMVEDTCPHCLKPVKSKHRQHVVACVAAGPAKVPPVRRVIVEGENAKPKRKVTSKSKATKALGSKGTGKKGKRSKRNSDSSDSD